MGIFKKNKNNKNKTFYFTFGSEGQLFEGGWVEVKAETMFEAQSKFINYYGEDAWKSQDMLNYASNYTQEEFERTSMCKEGNLGAFCHEVIE